MFNLAALLGLGAVVAGRIGLHRKVVILGGAVAMWIAWAAWPWWPGCSRPPPVSSWRSWPSPCTARSWRWPAEPRAHPLPRAWITWLQLRGDRRGIRAGGGHRAAPRHAADVVIAAAALLVVIAASVVMEQAASALGTGSPYPESWSAAWYWRP